VNPLLKQPVCESNVGLRARQNNDGTLGDFIRLYNLDRHTVRSVQRGKLLGLQSIGVGDQY
jgi:hypothetical protein